MNWGVRFEKRGRIREEKTIRWEQVKQILASKVKALCENGRRHQIEPAGPLNLRVRR